MSQIKLFHNAADLIPHTAGDVIFRAGDTGEFLYSLVEGQVDLLFDGRLLHTVETGELFGEMAILENTPHSVTARAHTDCKVARISRKQFFFMVDETPHFSVHVMQMLAERLRRETRRHGAHLSGVEA